MKINKKVLSIPPYLSTSWEEISSLHLSETSELLIILKTGDKISIPNLPKPLLDEIFQTHASILEQEEKTTLPFLFPQEGLDPLTALAGHDSSQSNAPNLPHDVLEKMKQLRAHLPFDEDTLPKPDSPHCNCPYCQIARALAPNEENSPEIEEEVQEEDLHFKEWLIEEIGENLYKVSHPLNTEEHYQVYLGKPIGCTCGHDKCEHIQAVLES